MSLNCVTLGVSSSKEIQRATTAGRSECWCRRSPPLVFRGVIWLSFLSLSLICVVVERELCVRDLYRTHLSLPNRKKNTPGLSYLFFSSSSSSALTRQGIPELKTFLEGFVFICRIFWYSSRGQLYFYDRRSCWRVESFDWLLHEIQVNAQSLTRNKRRR